MDEDNLKIKLDFILGLEGVVLKEIKRHPALRVFREENSEETCIYVAPVENFESLKSIKSVLHAYLIRRGKKYTPHYISNHKSILGDLISKVIRGHEKRFISFKITCAGLDSPAIRSIAQYIETTFTMVEKKEADLKIYIIKPKGIWEVGVQITPRPLSLRDYKVAHMSGAMDPTIAYAVNSFCNLHNAHSYLNVFSGSATLLIEAGLCFPNLEKLVGFDNNKKHLSLAVQNIKKAGLIRRVQIKEKDIFSQPDFGTFDAITSDLPFGMSISKGEDLGEMYQRFVKFCEGALDPRGRLVVYTSEHGLFKKLISNSKFKILRVLRLEFMTKANAYLHPKIFVCSFKSLL